MSLLNWAPDSRIIETRILLFRGADFLNEEGEEGGHIFANAITVCLSGSQTGACVREHTHVMSAKFSDFITPFLVHIR